MHPVLKSVIGVILGVLVAGLIIGLVELLGTVIHPLPEGIDVNDRAAILEHAKNAPVAAQVVVVIAWFFGTFIGAATAAWFAGGKEILHGLVVGGIFLLAGLMNLAMIPSPWWMWLASILIFPLASFLGANIVRITRATALAFEAAREEAAKH